MSEPILVSKDYVLVIDTNKFASFADALCAYCTGFCSERATPDAQDLTGVFYLDEGIEDDEDVRKGRLADDKNPFSGWVVDQLDEVGFSPCVVWPSRNYGTDTNGDYAALTEENYDEYNYPAGFSVGIYFDGLPPDELVSKVKDRAGKFFAEIYPKLKGGEPVTIEGFRMILHTKTAEEWVV